MNTQKRAKYAHLLNDPSIKRWNDNLARGSRVTADVSLRRLGNFCEQLKISPKELAKLSDGDLNDLLMDYVTTLEKQGCAGSYIESIIKAVRSWLSHNQRKVTAKIKIRAVRATPTLRSERTPSKEELKRIFLSADSKSRVAAVLMAHSGLRPEVIGNYEGNDGLRIRDLSDITIKDNLVEFKAPAMVIVRPELSKARHQYFTFLGDEGCGYIKDYIEERMRDGEKLGPNSPVVTPKTAQKDFIRSVNVGDAIRAAIRKAGFSWRPYVLRAYFDTQLMLAESKGLVLRDYRTFWMGHMGDIENRYTTNKQRLPDDVVDNMRDAYLKSLPYLETTKNQNERREEIMEEFRKQLLLVAGFKNEEMAKIPFASLSDDEFQTIVRQRLLGAMVSNGHKQKVIPINGIEDSISQGWEFMAALPNHKAIMRLPF